MKLAIVGSRVLANSAEAVRVAVKDAIRRHGATTVISGGAEGVDTIAVETALRLGLRVVIYHPAGHGWPYYKARNQKIAEDCDVLLRIASSRARTYGSGWARDHAKALGKPTEEIVLP